MQKLIPIAIWFALGASALGDIPNLESLFAGTSISVANEQDAFEKMSWKKKEKIADATLLVAIAQTSRGRRELEAFLRLWREKKVKVRFLPTGTNTAGGYREGEILLDSEVPVIANVVTLFHEMVHAGDWLASENGQERWKKFKSGRKHPEYESLLLHSEFLAYQAQNEFVGEWIALGNRHEEAIRYSCDFRYQLPHPISEEVFKEVLSTDTRRGGYGVKLSLVEEFLKTSPLKSKSN